ncbi:Nucleoside-diphosphate-sugar epimerase [Paracoccus halophilus]|uniref:NAD-dependent epimerase n=1 Tax=Paracoccus halophilus TaxID=376733 RepID=A0A099F778_9RHOB|nr:D-erythronate dehydrogenase [Paracoccus halophilus]KGJ06354.1 NAD-dependent epimerase [Paracoccus halophilus]SFA38908.1 Nucleoside-diphosphate-sugar epimerase [Paracoccus halophilus]
MKVLIIGGAGMVGRNLAGELVASGRLGDKPVTEMTLFDVAPAATQGSAAVKVTALTGDISDRATVDGLIAGRPDVIFHLAAIVSGEAEADFDKGYRINLDGTRNIFEAIRALGDYHPRVVYTSSIAVFGAPFPEAIGDDFITAPMTSYGAQKMIGELLLNDYSRRGIFDGVGIRLPTIVVRPGKPNKAASGFFSGIIREPLAGLEAVLPVDDDVRHWVASPAAATGFLVHAATMDTAPLGARRCLTMPGLAVTIAEMIAALAEVAGQDKVALIKREPDATIRGIVAGWPQNFDAARATEVGFTADASFQDIIRAHMRDMGQAG